MKNISKAFPGVKALDNVQFTVEKGSVHALLGENGAGKSTLVKILGGVHQPDTGEIRIEGTKIQFHSTKDAEKAGIAIIYQELNLIPQLTIAENIYLGREPKTRLGFIDANKMRQNARIELERLETQIHPDTKVKDLRIGEQQLVEIAKALSLHAKVVIMDEPTSALSDTETEKLFNVISKLQQNHVAIIYISHKLDEIFAIADKVTVLRDGKYIGTQKIANTTETELIHMMVGRNLKDLFPKLIVVRPKTIFQVDNLNVKHPLLPGRHILKNISFHVQKGEILGIAGLLGAGKSELMMSLFGAPPGKVLSGRFRINDKSIQIASPSMAIKNGLGLVTEDRKMQGLFLDHTVKMNVTIASLNKTVRTGLIDYDLENQMSEKYIQKLSIKIPNIHTNVNKLSGGNQQKVILARWLLTDPLLLMLDDPTRGIDIGSKAEIYQLMNQFVSQGMGIMLVSSELPELLSMSDRILVLNKGNLTAEFSNQDATEEKIMTAATHSVND